MNHPSAVLFCLLASASAIAASQEDWFKWGEYDSLIRVLEPETRPQELRGSLNTAADSAERAKSFLFLGVALYATGKPDRADSAFTWACDLDPGVKLDRFYVTEEIGGHFQAIALDGIRRRKAKEALHRAVQPQESGESKATDRNASGRSPKGREGKGKSWIWWGVGVGAVAATAGTTMLLLSRDEPSDNVTSIDAR